MNKKPLLLTSFVLGVIVTINIGLLSGAVWADPGIFHVDDDYSPSTPGWGIDHFSKIQDAVDAATDGDTIYVYKGTYHENIEVNEKNNLAFIAEKGGKPVKSVIVDAGGVFSGFDLWNSSGVKISGFKIINAFNGIVTATIEHSDYCDFSNNDIQNCRSYGIYITGNYCTVTGNFLKNTTGIECSFIGHEIIGTVFSKNKILDSKPYWGIDLWNGVNCSITNNFISNASVGIRLAYIGADCSGNVIMHNEITNVAGGIKFEEPVYPGTPPMTDNIIGHNYIHDITPYPGYLGYGINIEYWGGGAAETTQMHHNTIEDSDIGIRNHGNYGIVHHNKAINCVTDYIDLGIGNIDFKNSWNP